MWQTTNAMQIAMTFFEGRYCKKHGRRKTTLYFCCLSSESGKEGSAASSAARCICIDGYLNSPAPFLSLPLSLFLVLFLLCTYCYFRLFQLKIRLKIELCIWQKTSFSRKGLRRIFQFENFWNNIEIIR